MFRPLLAASIKSDADLDKLRYPLIASPKLDGIRCIIHPDQGPVTRTLKRIPNLHIRQVLTNRDIVGYDGEIMVEGSFNQVASSVMSSLGKPDFTYYVFDDCRLGETAYHTRLKALRDYAPYVKVLEHVWVSNREAVEYIEQQYLARGFEGVMLRDPKGLYKQNRSTLREQCLLKLKRFHDEEAEVVGFEELLRNDNDLDKDERGYAKRSHHQDNKIPMDMLGALILKSPNFDDTFKVGTGYDETTRRRLWADRDNLLGRIVTFKHQPIGAKDRPRFPVFLRIRED